MPEPISINDVIVNGEPTIAPDTGGGGGTDTTYTTDDPASTTINDTDYVPMSDANGNRKKTLWSNIISKIKTAFGIESSGDTYLKKDGTWGTPTGTTYSDATQSVHGLMSATDKTKLDGIDTGANNYSLPLAASGTRGGIKIGYTQSGKNYPVQLSSEKAYVNVPWTDTNTWRGIQDNLTSSSATDSLSANQGRILNNKFGNYDTSDEVNSKITNATSDVVRLVSFSKSYTISWQTNVNDLISVPSGYTAIAPIRWDTGSNYVAVLAVKQNALALEKTYSQGTSITATASGYVLCVKSSYVY